MELFIEGERIQLARYPNENLKDCNDGWLWTDEIIQKAPASEWQTGNKPIFKYYDSRIETWDSYEEIYCFGQFGPDYFSDDVKVGGIDTTQKTVTLASTIGSGANSGKKYYFYNVLDELDTPGEYYIDRANKILYLYQPKDLSNVTLRFSDFADSGTHNESKITEKAYMVRLTNVSNMTFSGITFELTKKSVMGIFGGENVQVNSCNFYDVGIKAIYIGSSFVQSLTKSTDENGKVTYITPEYNNERNGINHGINSCDFRNCGYGGVEMNGGSVPEIKESGYYIINSNFKNCSRLYGGYSNAINYYGSGFRISHNKITDAINHAVMGKALNLMFDHNEMSDVCRQIQDAGALYTNYRMPLQGIHFRYNYIHDIPAADHGHTYWNGGISARSGLYTDSDLWYPESHGNVFVNMPIGYSNSGKMEKHTNNIFIDCDTAMLQWIDTAYATGYTGEDVLGNAIGNLTNLEYPFDSQLWKDTYPEFYEKWERWLSGDDMSDFAGEVRNNLLVYNKKTEWYSYNLPEKKLQYTDDDDYIYEDNIVTTEDPGFVDMKNGNYQLRDDAPIYSLIPDFEKLDMETMGIMNENVGTDMNNAVVIGVGTNNAMVDGVMTVVDKENSEVMPVVCDDRTLVPVRFVSESFGCDVKWDENEQKVTITSNGKKIEMIQGENKITVDGEEIQTDVAAQNIGGRIMIPLRILAEQGLEKNIYWNDNGLIVISDAEDLSGFEATAQRLMKNLTLYKEEVA